MTTGAGDPVKETFRRTGCPRRTVTLLGVRVSTRGGMDTGPSKEWLPDRLVPELDAGEVKGERNM